MKLFHLAALILIITGCASAPEKFTGPNNKDAYSIDCRRSMTECYKQAIIVCPNGYNVIGSTSSSRLVTNTYTNQSISVAMNNFAVECK